MDGVISIFLGAQDTGSPFSSYGRTNGGHKIGYHAHRYKRFFS